MTRIEGHTHLMSSQVFQVHLTCLLDATVVSISVRRVSASVRCVGIEVRHPKLVSRGPIVTRRVFLFELITFYCLNAVRHSRIVHHTLLNNQRLRFLKILNQYC